MISEKNYGKGEVIFYERPLLSYFSVQQGYNGRNRCMQYFQSAKNGILEFAKLTKENRERALMLYFPPDELKKMDVCEDLIKEFLEENKIFNIGINDVSKMSLILSYNQFQAKKGEKSYLQDYCSRINHSCDPNCIFMREKDDRMSIRTIKDIKKGEDIRITYLDETKILFPTQERRELLQLQYSFDCQCDRCCKKHDDMLSYKCQYCKTGYLNLKRAEFNTQQCNNCGKQIELKELFLTRDIMNEIVYLDRNPMSLFGKIQMKNMFIEIDYSVYVFKNVVFIKNAKF